MCHGEEAERHEMGGVNEHQEKPRENCGDCLESAVTAVARAGQVKSTESGGAACQ